MGAAGLPQVQILGAWSASTFLSGFHGAKQPGLLEKLGDTTEHDKTFITNGDGIFICKDFTTVISMQRDRRAEILSQLREIHDGEYRKDFGTGVTKIGRGRVTMIAAVTPALDRAHGMSAALGERFLKIRWDRPELEAGEAAIDQQTSERNIAPALIKAVGDVFLDASKAVPEISNAVRRQIATIANLVAFARAYVYRNAFGNREIIDVSVPEANTRIAKGAGRDSPWGRSATAQGCCGRWGPSGHLPCGAGLHSTDAPGCIHSGAGRTPRAGRNYASPCDGRPSETWAGGTRPASFDRFGAGNGGRLPIARGSQHGVIC
jgi:hypothetical protein